MNSKFKAILKAAFADILLSAIVLVIFGKAMSYGLVWDDHLFIKEPYHEGVVQSAVASFTHGYIQSSDWKEKDTYYRPLTAFIFKLQNSIFKGEAFGYHLFNIIIHLFNVLLLRRLGILITGNNQIAFTAAAFFAVFPLNIESVVWISGRTDLIATLFILSAVVYHLKQVKKNDYNETKTPWVLLLFYLLACLSKESGCLLLLIIPSLGIIYKSSEISIKEYFRRFKNTYIALILSSVLLIIVRLIVIPEGLKDSFLFPNPLTWIISAVATFFKYLLKLFYPFDPDPYIVNPYINSVINVYFILGLLAAAGAVFIFLRMLKIVKEVSFLLLFVLLCLVPAMNIVRIGSPFDMGFTMADRYTYLPFCGVSILAAWTINNLLTPKYQNENAKKNFFLVSLIKRYYILCLIIIILFGSVNFISSNIYKNDEVFYSSALRTNSDSRLLRVNMAVHYWERHDYKKAMQQMDFLRENKIAEDADMLNIEGVMLFYLKKPAEAIDKFANALKKDKNNLNTLYNYGMLYLHLGLPDNAIQYFNTALQKNPNFSDSKLALSLAYQRSGKINEAAKIYSQIYSSEPNNTAILTNYGSLLFETDEQTKGEAMFQKAISMKPNDEIILYNYARCLVLYTDQLDKALETAERIMQINPSFPALYPLMTEIYFQKKEYNRALRWANAGLALHSADEEIKDVIKLKITELYEVLGIKR